jgi:hypothetical protein
MHRFLVLCVVDIPTPIPVELFVLGKEGRMEWKRGKKKRRKGC